MSNRTLDDPDGPLDPLDQYDQRMRAKQTQQGDASDQEQLYRGKRAEDDRPPIGPLIRDAQGDPVGDVDQAGRQAGYQPSGQKAGEPFRKQSWGQDKTTWGKSGERGPPDE